MQQVDFVLLDVPMAGRALNTDAGIVLGRRDEHAGHEVAKVHRRQQLDVARRLVHARLVDELVVPADIAGPLARHEKPARIVGDVVFEVGNLGDRRYAVCVIFAMARGALVEHLECRGMAADGFGDRS